MYKIQGVFVLFLQWHRWVIYTKIRGLLQIFFVMVEVGNLDTCLGKFFQSIFIMAEVGNLLEKITNPMVIIIRVVGLMAK